MVSLSTLCPSLRMTRPQSQWGLRGCSRRGPRLTPAECSMSVRLSEARRSVRPLPHLSLRCKILFPFCLLESLSARASWDASAPNAVFLLSPMRVSPSRVPSVTRMSLPARRLSQGKAAPCQGPWSALHVVGTWRKTDADVCVSLLAQQEGAPPRGSGPRGLGFWLPVLRHSIVRQWGFLWLL